MALSSLAHEQYFQKQREKQLPPLSSYFRRADGETRWDHYTPLLYSPHKLLNLREMPVSNEAFKYWFSAFVQRLAGEVSERNLLFMAEQDRYYPTDDEELANFALPLDTRDPQVMARQLARFRKIYDYQGVFALRELAESLRVSYDGAAEQAAVTEAYFEQGRSDSDRAGRAEAKRYSAADEDDQARLDDWVVDVDMAQAAARMLKKSQAESSRGFAGSDRRRPQWVNAYIALQMTSSLRRRYRYIKGHRVDIVEDSARFAAFDNYFRAAPELRIETAGDLFMRMGVDLRHMAAGARALDWSFLTRTRAHVHLSLAAALRERRAVIDLTLNNALVEIKPVRHLMVQGATDQLLAYYLMYTFQYPDHPIDELRFYLARHATWVVASMAEIRATFPVRAFAELLWDTTESFLVRAQQVDFDRFCHRQAHVAGINAWRMEDQIHSQQRRYERAGRIGVTRIASQREVPHAITEVLAHSDNQALAERLQRVAEAQTLQQVWRAKYELWHTELRTDYAVLCAYKDAWRAFVERL